MSKTPLEVVVGERGVTGLKVRNNAYGEEEILDAGGVFVAIGHHPDTGFINGQIDTDENGYIITVPGTSITNIPGELASTGCSLSSSYYCSRNRSHGSHG